MNLTYPINMPSVPSPRTVTFGATNLVSAAISPFTGSSQITQWPGEWWEAEIALPPMSQANAAPWLAFLTGLRGQAGTFLLGDPARKTPQGVATGTPLVNGVQTAGSTTLVTDGWTASTAGILKAGDYIQIGYANLLLYSQDATQGAWTKTTATIGTGITDPNSGTTAQSITGTGSNSNITQTVQACAGTYTFSVWLKAASSETINIFLKDMPTGNSVSFTACSVTTSWTRFSVTGTYTGANTSIGCEIGGGNTIGNGTVVDFWGAQLEYGSNVNPYQVTTTAQVSQVQRIYQLTTDANSDSGGNATLSIFPALRPEGALDEQVIVTSSPKGTFRLVQNWRQWQVDFSRAWAVSFKATEAL